MKPTIRIIGGVAILAIVAVLFGQQAIGVVLAGYPRDTIKREALARCAAADPHFVRFSQRDRTECYQTAHLPVTAAANE